MIGGGLAALGFEHSGSADFFDWQSYQSTRTVSIMALLFFCCLSGVLLLIRTAWSRVSALFLLTILILILGVISKFTYLFVAVITIPLASGTLYIQFGNSIWTTAAQSLLYMWLPLTSIALLTNQNIAQLFYKTEGDNWQENDILDSSITLKKQRLPWVFHDLKISQTLGFMFILLGAILLSLTLDLRNKNWLIIFCHGLTWTSFVLGIGLVLRQHFARWGMIVIWGSSSIAAVWSLLSFLSYYWTNPIYEIAKYNTNVGILMGLCCLLLSGLLLFSNKVIAEECDS